MACSQISFLSTSTITCSTISFFSSGVRKCSNKPRFHDNISLSSLHSAAIMANGFWRKRPRATAFGEHNRAWVSRNWGFFCLVIYSIGCGFMGICLKSVKLKTNDLTGDLTEMWMEILNWNERKLKRLNLHGQNLEN